jgi:glyoxylase-like metal-dependent hydrolase (beta-lactamase superfamily II)
MPLTALPGSDEQVVRARGSVGDFELILCSDGTYALDGGAMFGVVPKSLWQRRIPAAEDNTIQLGCNTVIVRTGSAVVLIETGIGNKHSPKQRAIFRNQQRLPASLAAAGIRVEDVTHVVNTHLHFDHCGWNTTLHADGSVTPTFPGARYFAAAGELAHARLQLERDAVSYLAPNFDPLIAAGQLTLIDPACAFTPQDPRLVAADRSIGWPRVTQSLEIVPGISVEPFPGHTASMLGVHIVSGDEHACYPGDLVPTHHHLDPTWVMGYDLDPLTCIEQRRKFLTRAIAQEWLVLFTHDHEMPFARLAWNEKGKPVVQQTAV